MLTDKPIKTRRLLVILLVVALLLSGAAAAQESAPATYPTQTALEQAVITRLDRVSLAQRFRGVGEIPPPPLTAPLHTVGEQGVFQVIGSASNEIFSVTATLRVVSDHLYIWVDDRADINEGDLAGLAASFESEIYEPVRDLWGSEATPGIDGDTHLYALFAYGVGPGVGAYYSSNNAYPTAVMPDSNEHEMFVFNLDTLGTVGLNTVFIHSIIAHEFQHMIRDNMQAKDYWLNEGFSTFTQLYLYGEADVAQQFLVAPGTQLNTWAEDPAGRRANYGAALLFTTYLYERFGLDALHELSADSQRGLAAVDAVLRRRSTDVNTLFADWVLANFLMDTTLADGEYGYDLLPTSRFIHITPEVTATAYPFMWAGQVNQYATDYYVFNKLPDSRQMTIMLEAPETVTLLPTAPYSGRAMWYSNRADFSETTLTRAFDLREVGKATLRYQAWYALESDWDYAYLMVSADDGATWDILPTSHTITGDTNNAAYGPAYTGDSGGWITESVVLDAYAGHEILVRFAVITDDAITQPGLALDDVQISEIGYFDDFETADSGWQASGWVWIDNVLPQYAWVQAVQRIGQGVTVTRWLTQGSGTWTLPLDAEADQVIIAISPLAEQTTVPMSYTLRVE
ncbi:MAG: immune inhibitor A [Anaerolineaceae bacterium]|nr:immune inhibitor A [Anaerolineaceae bacterium]